MAAQKNKHIPFWVLSITVIFTMGYLTSCEKETLKIVSNGQVVATIILPEETEFDRYVNMTPEQTDSFLQQRFPNASSEKLETAKQHLSQFKDAQISKTGDEEELAIAELIEFIKKISGAELPVIRLKNGDPLPNGNLILIGNELAIKEGFKNEQDSLTKDGFIVKVKNNKLILSGRRARGTLYAVYDFLESVGCRWIMPGTFGEIYPEMKNIETNINVIKNPSHSERNWWCTYSYGTEFPRWTLRNKGNFVRALGDSEVEASHASEAPLEYGANFTNRGINVKKTFSEQNQDGPNQPVKEVFIEKEIKQLPDEYYTISQGKINTHLANMSNPKVWDLCAGYYRDEYFYNHPLEDYVSVSSADGLVVDDREASRKLDSKEFDWTMGAQSATDRLLFFHNRYIDSVVQEHPDRKFAMYVYSNNMMPPRIETIHHSMALVFAPLGICPLHDINNPNCPTNKAYKEWIEDWMPQIQAGGAEAFYHDYLPIGFQWSNFMISPQWQIIGRNYPWLHKMGFKGHTAQGFDDWGAMGLSAWVAIRLYWDVTQDYNDVVQEYCEFRFGKKAANIMHDYYKVFEKRMDEVPDLCSNETYANHLAIDAQTRSRAREILTKAKSHIKGQQELEQFETVNDFQTAMDAWCDGIDYARETGDFSTAADKMKISFEIAEKLNKIYSHFITPHNIEIDNDEQSIYHPGGWYKKYLAWDNKIKGSKVSVVLPRFMKVTLDTDNSSSATGLQKPGTSVENIDDWDVTIVPDVKFKTERQLAAFFYRMEIDVPSEFSTVNKISLYYPSIIARALQIWINGEAVQFDNGNYKDKIWRGHDYFWDNYDHQQEFDVTSYIKPGQKNTIAFRVFKSFDHGGTYDRIFLLGN